MSLTSRYEEIKKKLHAAQLIAVSKRQPQEKIQHAIDVGIRHFVENRIQEAYEHWEKLKPSYPDLVLHLIGPLQSNKAKDAVALFDVIHTVDREKIARILADQMQSQGKNIPCFIQVNTGNEPQKSGVSYDDLDAFYDFCTQKCGLDIIGLMAIPPVSQESAEHFKRLKQAANKLGLDQLSMGMSNDYEQAIACGSSYVRIGSALFGQRLEL